MAAATTPPNPADRDRISEAVDEMEERVVGYRVNPPRSDDVAGTDAEGQDGTGEVAGPRDEPS